MARTMPPRLFASMIGLSIALPASSAPLDDAAAVAAVFDHPRVLLARAIPSGAGDENRGCRDVGAGVSVVSDGAIIVGWTSQKDGKEDALLVRVNDAGDAVWRKSVANPGHESLLWDVHADGHDGFVAAGYSDAAGTSDGWLVRFTSSGEISWEKRFDMGGVDRFYMLAADASIPGGGWLCVGQSDDKAGKNRAWVVRTDASGRELSHAIWSTDANDRAFAAQPIGFDCVVGGMTGRGHDDANGFIARVDASGTERWRYVMSDWPFSVIHGIKPLADGHFLVSGYRNTRAGLGSQGFILVIDEMGNVLRQTSLGGPGNDRTLHALAFSDGSCAVIGHSQSPDAADGRTGWDMSLFALDREGGVRFSSRFGGKGTEFGRGIDGTASDLWLVGHTESPSGNESRVYVVRLDLTTQGDAKNHGIKDQSGPAGTH